MGVLNRKVDAIARMLLAQESAEYDAAHDELVGLMEQVEKSMGVEEHTYALLDELGLTEETNGFRCMFEALVLLAKEPGRIDGICVNVYGAVGSQLGFNWQKVERCIHSGVERIFNHGDSAVLDRYFGRCTKNTSGMVSSGAFLARLSREIRRRVKEGQEC